MAVLAAAALLASCSKDAGNDPAPVPAGPDAIRATARSLKIEADATEPGSKAAYAATDANNLKAAVVGSQTSGNYATAYVSGTMTFKAGTSQSDAVAFDAGATGATTFPADKSSIFLTALYPDQMKDNSKWDFTAGTTGTVTFAGTEDIMASPQSEVAKDGGSDASKAKFASFDFKHLLTFLTVTVKAEDDAAVAAWGDVQSVKITKLLGAASFHNKVAVTLADGTAATGSAFTETVTQWPLFSTVTADAAVPTTTLTTTKADLATTLIAPFTAVNSGDLTLEIVTKTASGSAVTSTVDVKVPAGDTQGKAYNINLTFKTQNISGVATITGWGTPTDINQDVI